MSKSGKLVVQWRAAMGLTQLAAAEALGCSRAAIISWERGHTNCPRYILLAMAAIAKGLSPWGKA